MPKLFEYTAVGRYYHVYKEGEHLSQHAQEREAIENANKAKLDFPESDVYYTHDYEVDVGLTDAGLTVAKSYTPAVDQPPTITSTPSVSFTEGAVDTYDFSQHVSDDGISALSYSLTNVLPNGLTLDSATGILTYDGVEPATTSQHQLTATDAVGSDTSSLFDVTVAAVPAPGIVFETNFANDAGFSMSNIVFGAWSSVTNPANHPADFDGAVADFGTDCKIYAVEGAGYNGGRALKLEWGDSASQPQVSLFKHLTDDANTGYNELYIRYRLKLPDAFQMGDPAVDDIPYWKFGRLFQNGGPDPTVGSAWSENRADSGFVVWNFGGTDIFGVFDNITCAANTGSNLDQGSAGGERYSSKWYVSSAGDERDKLADFRHVGRNPLSPAGDGWDFSRTTRLLTDTSQEWHTIEWRFKMSSTATANDGVWQVWFDGEEQSPPANAMGEAGGASALPGSAPNNCLPTTYDGRSGYNFLTVFDNMTFINDVWDSPEKGGIFISDIVVSESRIGTDYEVT